MGITLLVPEEWKLSGGTKKVIGLLYPWKGMVSVQVSIKRGSGRSVMG